jgi:hypothetical protein
VVREISALSLKVRLTAATMTRPLVILRGQFTLIASYPDFSPAGAATCSVPS